MIPWPRLPGARSPRGLDSVLHTHRSGRGSDPSWPAWRSALWHHRRWVSATISEERAVRTVDAGWNEFETRGTTYSGNTAPVRQSGLGQALSATQWHIQSSTATTTQQASNVSLCGVFWIIKTKHSEHKAEKNNSQKIRTRRAAAS